MNLLKHRVTSFASIHVDAQLVYELSLEGAGPGDRPRRSPGKALSCLHRGNDSTTYDPLGRFMGSYKWGYKSPNLGYQNG